MARDMTKTEALQKAVDLAGSQSELARRIGVKPQNVSLWLKAELPTEWVMPVARAIEFQVTPHDLDGGAYPNAWDGLPVDQAKALLVCVA